MKGLLFLWSYSGHSFYKTSPKPQEGKINYGTDLFQLN